MKAEDIFLAALERCSPGERAAYLDEACGTGSDLRAEVEGLLCSHEQAGSFLQGSLFDPGPTGDVPPPEPTGSRIGPYKLVQAIGEGGMGTVYLAEQAHPVRRRVALKVIKPGMDTRQVIARFEAERQALALMDHPNIAKVLDAGATPEGRPYFAMELVKGLPITRYCDERRMSLRERLGLFVPVCQAVQHAHQKGVIHRDLKPSNVLVAPYDGVPVVKVIDFGVAKAAGQPLTERTLVTGLGAVVGTLEYMSPEQAELNNLDIDTRSDIYSLGVLLYELLTGTTPLPRKDLEKAGLLEMLRVVREQEPTKPSTKLSTSEGLQTLAANRGTEPAKLRNLVRGELDWIVMKALEKDRTRRYETANSFAMDLQRYLANEPVQAYPPSARYRFEKFIRRNRAMVIPTAILTLLTIVGLSIGMAVVTRERDEARAQRQRADARFRLAFQALYRLRLTALNLHLAAGPERTAKLKRTLEEDCARYHRQLMEGSEDDPGIAFEIAESHFYLAMLMETSSDDVDGAERYFRQSVTLFESLAKTRPDDTKVLGSLANTLLHLGHRLHKKKGFDPVQAEAILRRSLGLFEQIARTHPDHVNDWYLICNHAEWGYGRLLRSQGRFAESEALNGRVLAWFDRPGINLNWFGQLGGARARGEGFDGFMALSRLLVRHGQPLRAIPILERAKPYLVSDRDYYYYAVVLQALALKLAADPDPAVRARAVPLARENLETESRTDANAWLLLGLALEQTGDLEGSDDAFRRGIELGGDEADNTLNGFAWRLVSEPQFRTFRPIRAVQMAERAVRLTPAGAHAWKTLGVARYRAADWAGAIETLEKAEALAPGRYHSFNGFFLAMAHWQLGDHEKARTWYGQAARWMDKNRPQDEELRRFRAEAAELLELNEKK